MKTLGPEAPPAPVYTARDSWVEPWPAKGEETGVMAVAPEPIQQTA
jgi:hypothetical protein